MAKGERLELALNAAVVAVDRDQFLTPNHTRQLLFEIHRLRNELREEKTAHLRTIYKFKQLIAKTKKGVRRELPQPVQR